jgi:hypothetical protein
VAVVDGPAVGVPIWKLVLVTLATGVWSVGVFVNAGWHRDDWPLSAFAMYSDRARPDAIRDRMFGIADEREFPLTPGHTYPVAGTRLNFMLRRMHGETGRAALRAIRQVYEIQRRKGEHEDPPLTAVRTERQTWHTNIDLKGIDKPRRKITMSVLFPPDELLTALEAEAHGDPAATLGAPHAAGPEDVVLELEKATVVGSALRVDDAHASRGAAVSFPEAGPEERPEALQSGASLAFDAPHGTYTVWIRLKALPEAHGDSLWVSFDGMDEDAMVDSKSGIGTLPEQYPNGAFAWSGSALPGPRVKLRGEHHTVYVAAHEGPVIVDQIWLSQSRREIPLFHEPVAK